MRSSASSAAAAAKFLLICCSKKKDVKDMFHDVVYRVFTLASQEVGSPQYCWGRAVAEALEGRRLTHLQLVAAGREKGIDHSATFIHGQGMQRLLYTPKRQRRQYAHTMAHTRPTTGDSSYGPRTVERPAAATRRASFEATSSCPPMCPAAHLGSASIWGPSLGRRFRSINPSRTSSSSDV